MRRVFRPRLSARAERTLAREQNQADRKRAANQLNIEREWNRARRNLPLREALGVLHEMAGNRQRCMYCGDSHGTDIEHFWPKAPYPERMFRWPNMLLCCTECGRFKGNSFPLLDGQPALIDPSSENPWDFLDFDPQTGNIVARYDPQRQQYAPKGNQMVSLLQFDRREAMARGYKRTFRRIQQKIQAALEQPNLDAHALMRELIDDDDHGLLGWCFDGLGHGVPPFSDLRERRPIEWHACLEAYRQQQAG